MPSLPKNAQKIKSATSAGKPRIRYTIDGERGLVLQVMKTGTQTWYARYSELVRGKRTTTYKQIGDARVITLGQAIDSCREKLAKHELSDPKEIARPALTINELFAQWLEKDAKLNKKTWPQDEYRFNLHVKPRIGHRIAGDVQRSEATAFLDEVLKSSGQQANKVLAIIRRVYNFGLKRDLVGANPFTQQDKPSKEMPRERVLTDIELARLWQTIGSGGLDERFVIAWKLLLLTGQRPIEILTAQKEMLDFGSRLLAIPSRSYKTERPHGVPITEATDKLWKRALELSAEDSPYVFASHRGGPMRVNALSHAAKGIIDKAKIRDAVLYDSRGTVATGLAKLGIDPELIPRVLGHVKADVTSRHYNMHAFLKEKRAALETWEQHVFRVVG